MIRRCHHRLFRQAFRFLAHCDFSKLLLSLKTTNESMNTDEQILRNIAREFEEGFNSGDVDRLMRFYAETYVDVNLRNPVQSKVERREYYSRVMARRGFRVRVHPDDIVVRDQFAFVRGTLLLEQSAGTQQPKTELRYLEIYERTSAGDWKVIWGMDGPVQEYEPAQES